jgi:signal transduction histidine kinase
MLKNWLGFLTVLAGVMLPTAAGLVCLSWLALRKTRQEIAGAAELRREISRRAAAERSMLEAQKLETLSVLTGGVAHDFNNLLAIISSSLHIQALKHPDQVQESQHKAMGRGTAALLGKWLRRSDLLPTDNDAS